MRFEEALVHLRAGKKIRCSAWNDKDAYLGYLCSIHSFQFEASIDEILNREWELLDKNEKYYQDGIELPTIHNKKTIEERFSDLELRLKEVQRFQDITHEQYISIAKKEKPHACPVCGGNGTIFIHNQQMSALESMAIKRDEREIPYKDCHACEGKGVLWK